MSARTAKESMQARARRGPLGRAPCDFAPAVRLFGARRIGGAVDIDVAGGDGFGERAFGAGRLPAGTAWPALQPRAVFWKEAAP